MNILYTCLKINIFKRFIAISLFSLVSLLCYGVTTYDWNAGVTISTDTENCQTDKETYYIKIHGNVTMNGYIKVGNGSNSVTVIVEIADGVSGDITLMHGGSAASYFRVYQNSKLIIRGKSNTQSNTHTIRGKKNKMSLRLVCLESIQTPPIRKIVVY